MRKILAITGFVISIILLIVWIVARICNSYEFSINREQYIKRAANANSIELASYNLGLAIEYLEENELTTGQVSIFLNQPKNDIGYWHENLVSAQEQLLDVSEDVTDLEESNILMKLRETLTTDSDSGTSVACPWNGYTKLYKKYSDMVK